MSVYREYKFLLKKAPRDTSSFSLAHKERITQAFDFDVTPEKIARFGNDEVLKQQISVSAIRYRATSREGSSRYSPSSVPIR